MSKTKRIITEREKENICQSYLAGNSIRTVQKQTKLQPKRIREILCASNIKVLSAYETQQMRGITEVKRYFNELNPLQCYVLGLIFGDGCVQHDSHKHRYSVTITSNDLDILESARKLFGPQFSIKKRKTANAYDLIIYSKHLCEELINNFKLKSPKSNSLIFPKLPNENYPHFISGLLSTDGCIRIEKENKGKPCSIEFSYSSNCLNFILSLRKFLSKWANTPNINHIKTNITNRNSPNYVLRFKGTNATKILNYIYNNVTEDTLCKRKYQIYLDYIASLKPHL